MFRLLRSLQGSLKNAFIHDPEIRSIVGRHPFFFRFLKNRLTCDEIFGLHVTVGVAVSAVCFGVFIGVVRNILNETSVIDIDTAVLNFFQMFHSRGVDVWMMAVTYAASWEALLAGACGMFIIALFSQRRDYIIGLLGTLFMSAMAALTFQQVFEYAYPSLNTIAFQGGGFIISPGQLFSSFALYGFFAYIAQRSAPRGITRFFVITGTFIVFLSIAISRIYLGLEWPSDVFASSVAACAWLALLVAILEAEKKTYERRDRNPRISASTRKNVILTIGGFWIVAVAFFSLRHPFSAVVIVPEERRILSEEASLDELFASVPRTTQTLFGKSTEPINLIFVGTADQIDDAFRSGGWQQADGITIPNAWRAAFAAAANKPYPTAPEVPTFWNARPDDRTYQQPTHTVRERRHIHLWKTSFETTSHVPFWVGTAHYDRGIKLKTRILVPTHAIDPAIDKERDAIVADLEKYGKVVKKTVFQVGEPVLGRNSVGDQFFTDGKAYSITLR